MRTSSQLLLTFLFNAGWQLLLIATVAGLCDRLLRETSARYRHVVWVAALIVSFGLPLVSGSLFLGRTFFSEPAQATIQPASIEVETLPQFVANGSPASVPVTLPPPMKRTSQLLLISEKAATVIAGLYFLLLCYRGRKLLLAWGATRAILRNAYSVELPEHVRTTVEACQTALGVKQFRLLCSSAVTVPVTVGSLDPLVILPEQLLQEADRDLLISAIGHELVHVRRRDYLFNLLYEFIALPLAFHPATALVRRRIRETRELGCDELVTECLLDATVYARSLVRLAGAAITVGSPTTTMNVGIADADILEERVMTMLKRSKTNAGKKSWLLIAATLCFAVPCMAAVPFAFRININSQDAAATSRQSTAGEPGTLVTWLKKPGDIVEHGDAIAVVNTGNGRIEAVAKTSGVVERLLVQPGEKVPAGAVLAVIRPQEPSVGWAVSTAQQEERERNDLREERLKAQAELEVQRRAEREIEERAVTLQTLEGTVTVRANTQDPQREAKEREERMLKEARMKEEQEGQVTRERRLARITEDRAREEQDAQTPEIMEHRRAERAAMAKRQAELVKEARLTMQQAIQIATSQYPGTVLESRLVREGPQHQASYILTILSDNGAETTRTRVLMSAIDGNIINVMKEER